MKILKNKETVIPVDENGNPIEPEKKEFDWKGILKKTLCGVACGVGGIVLFLVVGAAMVNTDEDKSSEESSSGETETDISKTEGTSEA